jgi:uncharacterized protein DUF5076
VQNNKQDLSYQFELLKLGAGVGPPCTIITGGSFIVDPDAARNRSVAGWGYYFADIARSIARSIAREHGSAATEAFDQIADSFARAAAEMRCTVEQE